MSFEEKRAWIMVVVSTAVYAVYASLILSRAGSAPLADVPYVATLVWSVVVSIVASIVLNIVVAIAAPKGGDKKDQRDREINRFGDHVGQSFLVIGGVGALLLAMAESAYFWIANVIYLGFVLSAILGSVAKIVAYRRGFRPW